MNKRLEEIYKQAVKQDYVPNENEEVYMSANDLSKFAELIVRDTIYILQLGMVRNGPNTPENLRTKKHMKEIYHQFGIEPNYAYVPKHQWDIIDNMYPVKDTSEDKDSEAFYNGFGSNINEQYKVSGAGWLCMKNQPYKWIPVFQLNPEQIEKIRSVLGTDV